jgi:NitT/TauT family transport system substrate-binding protein
MKRFIIAILAALTLTLTACTPNATPTPSELSTIRLPMGFIPNIQYAPFYVAVEKGYFAEAGIEIEFDYSFETNGIKLTGAGETPFAVVSGEQVLLAREQDIPVVYVSAWFQDFPITVVTKAESGINTIADLAGKQVGLPDLLGASYIGLRAMLDQAGLQESDLTLDSIGFNQVEALATDREDAVVGYFSNEPIQLRSLGYEVVELRVADYVTLASNGLITNEKTIAENPELVRKMVSAFLRGLNDTITNPEEAYTISLNFVEGLEQNDEVQMEVLTTSIDFWRAEKPGTISLEAWSNMHTVLVNMGQINEALDVSKAFSNEFIP